MPKINGNIVKIPLSNQEFAVGKIIHKSTVFKKCIIIGLFGTKYKNNDLDNLPDNFIDVFSTSIEAIGKKYKWEIIGNIPVRKEDIEKTRRIIAGEIWEEDRIIRKAEQSDYNIIRKDSALGIELARKRIENILEEKT